jgi:hypothetical protein
MIPDTRSHPPPFPNLAMHSIVSSSFTLSFSATDGSSTPSSIFDHKSCDESKANRLSNRLKKLFHAVDAALSIAAWHAGTQSQIHPPLFPNLTMHSVVASSFTLSSSTTDGSSTPSSIFDHKSCDESKTNGLSNQLKKLFCIVSLLESKVLVNLGKP